MIPGCRELIIRFVFVQGSDIEKLDPSIPFIPFKELEQATNVWDPTRKIGRGGFGVVYRGYWRETDIAIKRLEPPVRVGLLRKFFK